MIASLRAEAQLTVGLLANASTGTASVANSTFCRATSPTRRTVRTKPVVVESMTSTAPGLENFGPIFLVDKVETASDELYPVTGCRRLL